MLSVSIEAMNELQTGVDVAYKVILFLSEPEEYTIEDYLSRIGSLRTGMSREGSYEIANTEVELLNKAYYFSERFESEFPTGKLVEIYALIAGESILVFRGIVDDWELSGTKVSLKINA